MITKELMLRSCLSFIILMMITLSLFSQDYTLGPGVYPGNPAENFAPHLMSDTSHYRNIALNRTVFQSGSYDFNLTAQLVTDGIVDTVPPFYYSFTSGINGLLDFNQRNSITDEDIYSSLPNPGSGGWLRMGLLNNPEASVPDSIVCIGYIITSGKGKGSDWKVALEGSSDTLNWEVLSLKDGKNLPGEPASQEWRKAVSENLRLFHYSFDTHGQSAEKFYKFTFSAANTVYWAIAEMSLYKNGRIIQPFGPEYFTSAWKSAGNNNEWIVLDLGYESSFDSITLHWIRRALSGSVQISADRKQWTTVKRLNPSGSKIDCISFREPLKSRYIRLWLDNAIASDGVVLSEMEVYGKGGTESLSAMSPLPGADRKILLSGGKWKISRANLVRDSGENISKPGWNDSTWLNATVPGTILKSYINAGSVPDPNYSDNQLQISDSYFCSDFWYRTEFDLPSGRPQKKVFLNLNGINWKAEVFFNGEKLGMIEGAFIKSSFDISRLVNAGGQNSVAVRIIRNENPGIVKLQNLKTAGSNGGALGKDNPTFHASIGWDWIPTIRGRNTGIWNDVYLSFKGPVTIQDPCIVTSLPLPDTSSADLKIALSLVNHSGTDIPGNLRIKFGDFLLEHHVIVSSYKTNSIELTPEEFNSLRIKNPGLWWPNGYGRPYLYPVSIWFTSDDGEISDSTAFNYGTRSLYYTEENQTLKIYVNGRRFFPRGGNWGFSESNLSYRSREFDAAVRYHKEMNFNIIRNWVGQTANEEFYNACDKYGIMIWQDFWLANPADGPDPGNKKMFLDNARDLVTRIRNHPSLVLYCGRNEGYPTKEIDEGLREIVRTADHVVHYIPNSAFDVVSGGGPYRALHAEDYFKYMTTPKLHSEVGMPNIVNIESLSLMMPDSLITYQNNVWGIHDFCLESMQSCSTFNDVIEKKYGPGADRLKWLTFAQWVNYDGYRAIFEAQYKHRMGAILWMSHPAWPSMVWQTYDYYLEPTAAYFGAKKACEPLHILWDQNSDSIIVVNNNYGRVEKITATAEIIDQAGKCRWREEETLNLDDDSLMRLLKINRPNDISAVFFIRLKLIKDEKVISDNFYITGEEKDNLKTVNSLRMISLSRENGSKRIKDGSVYLTEEVTNNTNTPALMIRVKAIRNKSLDRILPVIYSDNYFSMMPGESRNITVEVKEADTRGENPELVFEGLNILN
jgi:hypothetical protein